MGRAADPEQLVGRALDQPCGAGEARLELAVEVLEAEHVRDAALQCAGCAVLFTRAFDAAARLEIGGSGANKQSCLPTPVPAHPRAGRTHRRV